MSQANKWRNFGACFCSLSGGWWPLANESSTLNQILHLYIWLALIIIPFVIRLVTGQNVELGWISSIAIAVLVFLLKYTCLRLSKVSKFLNKKIFLIPSDRERV